MPNPSKHGAQASSFPTSLIVALGIAVAIAGGLAGWTHYRAHEQTPQQFAQSLSPSAAAESSLTLIGTLAPLGSFEYETAPLENRLAVDLRHAGDAYLRQEISRDQASEVKAQAESVYAVIAQATRVCRAAEHSGKCAGNHTKAEQLLREAKSEAGAIHDYVPGISYSE